MGCSGAAPMTFWLPVIRIFAPVRVFCCHVVGAASPFQYRGLTCLPRARNWDSAGASPSNVNCMVVLVSEMRGWKELVLATFGISFAILCAMNVDALTRLEGANQLCDVGALDMLPYPVDNNSIVFWPSSPLKCCKAFTSFLENILNDMALSFF